MTAFQLDGPLPTGRVVLEASAGTGKTYSLTALIVRHIVERSITADQFLVVTFTRSAANDLRERTRSMLRLAQQAFATNTVPTEATWLAGLLEGSMAQRGIRSARLRQAIAHFDEATITTIHGFCQQALAQIGLRSAHDVDAEFVESSEALVAEVCRDVLINLLADQPDFLFSNATQELGRVERFLVQTVSMVLANPMAMLVPQPGVDPMADRWIAAVDRAVAQVHQRQTRRMQLGYDQLISGLADALSDPDNGALVAEQLASRYRVVLVDEFQDTDPLQWRLFERAFSSGTLITVGDPKQAIYRFRGADVHAYLSAVADQRALGLTTNYRSDPAVLAGLETLFLGAQLGDPRILFQPVLAGISPAGSTRQAAAVQLRVVRNDPRLLIRSGKSMSTPAARQIVLDDLATRVVTLLADYQPGDIAILVPSHGDAAAVSESLRRANVPAVRTRTGSVLQTEAVIQWQLLLAALAQPHWAPAVRAAGMGWILAVPIEGLSDPDDDSVLAHLQDRCAQLAGNLRRLGVMAFFDDLKAQPNVLESLLSGPDGERRLTDLDHVAELLAATLHGVVCEPALVQRELARLCVEQSRWSDSTMRRIDSDATSVQITTVHAAKGLEYRVVLVPFAFKQRPNLGKPLSFVDGASGPAAGRVIDIAPDVEWRQQDGTIIKQREELSRRELDGDGIRLLYVALTRAKHRVEVWWANGYLWQTSAFARLLFDRDGANPINNHMSEMSEGPRGGFKIIKPAYHRLGLDGSHQQIAALAAGSNGSIDLAFIEPGAPLQWTHPSPRQPAELSIASTNGRSEVGDDAWRSWSFTRLTTCLEPVDDRNHTGTSSLSAAATEFVAGADELVHADVDDDDQFLLTDTQPASGLGAIAQAADHPTMWLAHVVAGAEFGILVHAVLEQVDFSHPDLAQQLQDRCLQLLRASSASVDLDALVAGLLAAIHTPLGSVLNGQTLADIGSDNRLAELTFDLPLGRLAASQLAAVVASTLPASDPFVQYWQRLAVDFDQVQLAGWMNGSIDALLRIRQSNGDHKFVVVDYKSNRLHVPGVVDPLSAYHPMHLTNQMEHHHYPLQALLYLVATHRYLRLRLGPAYSPDDHLGGASYLFVRGMVGRATPTDHGQPFGVCSWRPPTSTIEAVDQLFGNHGSLVGP